MKVVIVGGGFGGIKAARILARDKRFQVTLISDNSCFEYHAALYRSATGRSVLQVVVPLSDIFMSTEVRIVKDRIVKILPDQHHVVGQSGSQYQYDHVILAIGSVTAFYGIQGLEQYSYGIKNINQALELKQHLHTELSTKADNHYIIVGGGPSGVELAGELVAYLKNVRKWHRTSGRFEVDLVEAADRLLPMLSPSLSAKVTKRLHQLGVKIYVGTAVKGETSDKLMLPHGDIKSHTVIWTAGVANNSFYATQGELFKLGKGGRVEVDEYLQASKSIYVLGDSAHTPYSGLASTAVADGRFVAKNLSLKASGKTMKSYAPHPAPALVPVGPQWCAAEMGSLRLYGYIGWLARRWSDLKLLAAVLGFNLAWKTWLYGSQVEESCSVCETG